MNAEIQQYIPAVLELAEAAAHRILYYYNQEHSRVQTKSDDSPLTDADLAAHQILVEGLSKLGNYPVLSEEGEIPPFAIRSQWSSYWLIDPLDGTREFISRTGEFSVNIAFIHKQVPILGVIADPSAQICYWALRGSPAYQQSLRGGASSIPSPLIAASMLEADPIDDGAALKVIVSRTFDPLGAEWLRLQARLGAVEYLFRGSAVKMALIAHRAADLYPRFGLSCEWDTAAGQCILEATGAQLIDIQGLPLRYNQKASLNNPQFFAFHQSHLASAICG